MIAKPIISPKEASDLIKDGDSLLCAGFMGVGSTETIFEAMVAECPHKNLTLICNDAGWDVPNKPINGVAPLVRNKMFKKFIGCHMGLNHEMQKQNNAGEIEVNLIPMGSFVEKIRCGGAGLGGVLTPTGVGTEVEEGKQKIEVEGKTYLLETPLRANVALIKAKIADKAGNLFHAKTARNFNCVMATAADIVIVEAEQIVEIGELDPEHVHTPFILIDYLVQSRI